MIMKTKFLNLMMPMAVIAVALAGAFSTNAMEKSDKVSAAVPGFRHITGIPCDSYDMCENLGGAVCTKNGFVLYNLQSPGNCPVPLTRK